VSITQQARDRFMNKVVIAGPNECWLWTGKLDNGYGRFWLNNRTDLAHRVAWILAHGDIPAGLQIDHVCRNRACVNPAHLEPVTLKTNVLRGEGISARNARKTHCAKEGHELAGDNLYISPRGHRECVACQRQRVRDWRAAA
jgi:hypothetical protein